MPRTDLRRHALSAYQAALDAVGGRACVEKFLRARRPESVTRVAAVGKAAVHMTAGALDAMGNRLERALVITKRGYAEALFPPGTPVTVLEAAHPVPDRSSLEAGAALLAFVEGSPADAGFLFLISGGASSLVEVLPDGVAPDELARINEWMLASGLPIGDMNRIRKRVSRIKGGRLAASLGGRSALNLMISDVPGDDPRVIGSGPLVRHEARDLSVADLDLPGWLAAIAKKAPPLSGDDCFRAVESAVVAHPGLARDAAASVLAREGYAVTVHDVLLEGDAAAAGRTVAGAIASGPAGAQIWASETTVTLPENPGRGGRCQSLALSAATVLSGRDDCVLLAAGTDGTDGPGEDAGALVDGGTIRRGQEAGKDARASLDAADAGSFLAESGDLINTGPTGTNVMDVIIGIRSG
ncbi:MAG: DUF4147 domain-containing protein [Gammaproteobacteria bacterium]|nr:DUF4147 domain-containing protein [Gammaproteobacteria bacterium]